MYAHWDKRLVENIDAAQGESGVAAANVVSLFSQRQPTAPRN